MRYPKVFLAIFCCTASIFAQTAAPNQQAMLTPTGAAKSPATAITTERQQSFVLGAMDTTVDPCEDFYEYACGTWRKNNPVPSDKAQWARYNQLAEYNREVLRNVLEQAAHATSGRSQTAKLIGGFYSSCMNEAAVNEKGAAPLRPELARIAAISGRNQLMDEIARLHSAGVPAMFGFEGDPDLHDTTVTAANIGQGGLGLPDRDYYLNPNDKSKDIRAKYLAHIATMLRLAGDDPAVADREATAVLAIETELAKASFDRVKMRDPRNRDHKMSVAALNALAPNLNVTRFLSATGSPAFTQIYVVPPDFFQSLNTALDSISLDDWKTYLKWHVVRADAPYLSAPFVQEDYEFERHYLNGQREIESRWKRCVTTADRLLGQALGRVYVEQTFNAASKQRMLEMVTLEEQAMAEDIQNISWMSAETKAQALAKLKAVTNKIAYPDKWLEYTGVKIQQDNLLANVTSARAFDVRRNLAKIGKPVDKKEWEITTPTVNAYYMWQNNSINFPAGILQSPFFDPNKDDAVNFGSIGWLIGHELTHGFDDQGSRFDASGNLTNWWTQADREEFDKRTSCLVDQYEQYVVVDDLHINGKLTLGENTADHGGIRIALAALHKAAAAKGTSDAKIDGFSQDQRFFISFAQQWCSNSTPENLRVVTKVDPHSPVRYRTLGTLRDLPDFARAFGCKTGQKMVTENACRVW